MDPAGPPSAARRAAEGLTSAALLAVPLYIAVFTSRVFEGDKAGLARWLGLGVGLCLLAAPDRPAPRSRRLAWALGACLLAETLATVTSVAPWTSVLGSQARGQGLWTSLTLGALAWGAAALAARPGGAARLARLLGIGALPAGLYALAQALGLDPLPWEGPVMSRVVGPAGAAPMLAGQLVLALPFAALSARAAWLRQRRQPTPGGALEPAAWLLSLAVGGGALVLSASRGPILGLAAGLWLWALAAGARAGGRRGRRRALGLLLGAALGLSFLIALNRGAFPRLAEQPLLDRLATAFNPERNSTRARLRLWEGTTLALADLAQFQVRRDPTRPLPPPWRLLLGYGPESMHLVWAPYYPPLLAYDEPRGYMPDRAHSLFLDALLTGGLLGALGQLLLLGLGLLAALSWLLPAARPRSALRLVLPSLLLGLLLPLVALRLDGPWCLARSPWPAGACLLAPALGLGLLGGLGLGLARLAWRSAGVGPVEAGGADPAQPPVADAGLAGGGVASWEDRTPEGYSQAAGFAAAALIALAAQAFELQVSFPTVAGRLGAWAILGGLAGIGWRRARGAEGAGEAGDAGTTAGDATLAAGVIGLTLAFGLARLGQTAGGPLMAAGLIALGVGLSWLALRPRAARGGAGPARPALGLTGYTLLHLSLLSGLARGPAAAVPAAAASLLLYVAALLALVLHRVWRDRPPGSAGARSLALGGALLFLLALPSLAPTVADAWFKEAERGWQAPVSGLRREGKGGKAESYLDRALERYGRARALAPWEPAYALAEARAWVELADLLEARRREAAAGPSVSEAGRSATDGSSGADPAGPDPGATAGRWEAGRDEGLRRALAAIDRAELLAPGAPQPAMTRARALRLWGQWSTGSPEGGERLAAARAAYVSVMARAPGWPELQDEAAQTALLAGRPAEALALALDVVLRKDAFYRQAWRTVALAYEALGQPGLASAAYGAYFVDPRNSGDLEGRRAWLRVLAADGKLQSALSQAALALALAPGEATSHADLATLQAAAGDLAAARASARQALAISPGDGAIQGLVRRLAGEAGEPEVAEPVP